MSPDDIAQAAKEVAATLPPLTDAEAVQIAALLAGVAEPEETTT